ncbi:hypothetical protein MH117_12520 [Paenibacillus sp. ACRRX]|uniref:hypothetical protein n=1 Tax=unclassified Paenibacillus TaxID=185978 RepID=UPI001EF5B2B6|nr:MULTISPECIES: hypothetical protein [unclassified Paenibacillus]MCG7408248.1 hypothetical protein [Paenibacillus sp. ACRRX]MDK8181367.1 hypothetical protein [Paenibacillus sp. UMB4589-SE434]
MKAASNGIVKDDVIEDVKQKFDCTVLRCEGRPCLEYTSEKQLESISGYVRAQYDKDILDVFFTAIESCEMDED